MSIFFEKRQIVTPGEILAEGDYVSSDNTYKEGNKIYATRVGIADFKGNEIYVNALKAFYVPHIGDLVIGKIVDVGFSSWTVDIKAPYLATLRPSEAIGRRFNAKENDLPSFLDVGEILISKIIAYDRTRDPLLTIRQPGLGKITHGQIIEITPTKIPRIIGRNGSMINMLKKESGCQITVAQNGLILVKGNSLKDERLAIMAIRKIEQESHISGLTDRVSEMIKKEKGEKNV